MDGWLDGCQMDGLDGWLDGCWTDRWMDGGVGSCDTVETKVDTG